MKLRFIVVLFLITFCFMGSRNSGYAQDTESTELLFEFDQHISTGSKEKDGSVDFGSLNTFLIGPRINYTQGKHGFLGCAATFMWHNINYIPEAHLGFAVGMDLRLTKSLVYVPKVTLEYRYFVFLARVGYGYFTDFNSDFEHRISTELGLSLYGFLDITYLHSFGSERNPFQLENNYLNLTATIPLNL